MQTQITNAFAALNARIIESDQEFLTRVRARVAAVREEFKTKGGDFTGALIEEGYGSKTMYNLLHGRGEADQREIMEKNSRKLIEKRDAQIIKALIKAGVTELPEFELVEISDGLEGIFYVDGKRVSIRTIIAGGYNIQRLHNRTLVKVG